ncbi:MAG: peptidylprolyl isomerase [Candidatus Omnitrophica bacterium]|nr:peptidylprolyl isomerase [Candidatus Omnitrophota bacterium]
MNRSLAILLVLSVASFAGCAKRSTSDTLAIVNGKVITSAMVDDKIAKMPERYQVFAGQHKKEVLDEMVIEQLLYEEAKRRKIERDPDVKELMKESSKRVLISKIIEDETKQSAPVSADDVKNYYDDNKQQYMVPERVRASHVLTDTEQEADKAQEELNAGVSFADVAKSYSKDLTKDRGGDLGYFQKGQMIPEFEKVCFNLQPGETSDIVKTRFGYHIIKVTDRKPSTYQKFEDVKDRIRTILSAQRQRGKLDELIKTLKGKSKIVIDDSTLTPASTEPGQANTGAAAPKQNKDE